MARQMMTVRLDPAIRRRLASVARRRGRSASDLARTALEAWLSAEEGSAATAPYQALADLIGCVRGGDPQRSTRGPRWIATMLAQRRRRRT